MIHHVSLPISQLDVSARMYDAALAALGYRRVVDHDDCVGYGKETGKDKLLLVVRTGTRAVPGFHLALAAQDRQAVTAFHAAALAHGAKDNGRPGLRTHYGPDYFAAYVIDPDGHHLEAVINGAAP